MQSWTIGIICYNEKGTIHKVFEDVQSMLESFHCAYEIILVDDCSTDGSKEIIQQIAKQNTFVKAILHAENQGIGASIRDVYFNATQENLVFVPGDGQFDVFELKPFREFSANNYICFYRQENESYSLFRNILSYFNHLFNRLFLKLDLKDVNWVKAYKREIVQNLDLQMTSSIVESEICAKLNVLGHSPVQVKSTYLPRVYGESKGAALSNLIRVGPEIIRLLMIITSYRLKLKTSKFQV